MNNFARINTNKSYFMPEGVRALLFHVDTNIQTTGSLLHNITTFVGQLSNLIKFIISYVIYNE